MYLVIFIPVYLQDGISEEDALFATFEDHVSAEKRDLSAIQCNCLLHIFVLLNIRYIKYIITGR